MYGDRIGKAVWNAAWVAKVQGPAAALQMDLSALLEKSKK